MKHAAHARVSLEGKSTREKRTISKDGPFPTKKIRHRAFIVCPYAEQSLYTPMLIAHEGIRLSQVSDQLRLICIQYIGEFQTIAVLAGNECFRTRIRFPLNSWQVQISIRNSASRDSIVTKDICRVAVLHRAQVLLRVYVTYVRETTVLLLVVIDATTARVF